MRLYEVTTPGACPRTKATECSCESLRRLAEAEQPIKAVAVLGHGDAKGIINFVQRPGKATIISGTISGLTEGLHGFHIHEFGDLSDGCDSAGGHYNPHGVDHGDLDNGHIGDLGNIEANSKGVAEFIIKSKTIQLQGATSIVGRAVVVHQDEDDLGKGGDEESLKTGNAGDRAGCGVITLSELTESAIADLDKNISDKHFSRNEMPQVKEPDLIDNKIPYKKGKISITNIKPVQTDRVPGLAQKVAKDFHGKDKPFILDKNNYLVNGHHRYDAARLLGIEKVDAIKVDVPIELLMKKFSHTTSDTMVEDVAKLNADYKILDHDDDIVEYYDEIHPVVIKAWKSVYPNVPLKAIDGEDMYMQYTTADEYEHHGGNGKDFYLSLGVQYVGYEEPPMGYVNVGDAYAGNYKGVIAKIIAAVFEWLEQKHPNMGVRELGIHMNRNAEAWDAIAKKVGAQIEQRGYYENFADGKKKGKSRPGRVKKAGASCKGSVSSLRAKAKKYSGERGKMYHWCANMKSGKKKTNEDIDNLSPSAKLAGEYIDSEVKSGKIKNLDDLKRYIVELRLSRIIDHAEDARALWIHHLTVNPHNLPDAVNESAFENLKLPTWMSHTSLEKLFAQEYGPRYGDYVAHMDLDSDDDLAMNASGMGDMAFEMVKANDIKVMQKFLTQMPVQFTVDDLKLDDGIQVWHLVQQNKTVH